MPLLIVGGQRGPPLPARRRRAYGVGLKRINNLRSCQRSAQESKNGKQKVGSEFG